jgi:hypothetical protein
MPEGAGVGVIGFGAIVGNGATVGAATKGRVTSGAIAVVGRMTSVGCGLTGLLVGTTAGVQPTKSQKAESIEIAREMRLFPVLEQNNPIGFRPCSAMLSPCA